MRLLEIIALSALALGVQCQPVDQTKDASPARNTEAPVAEKVFGPYVPVPYDTNAAKPPMYHVRVMFFDEEMKQYTADVPVVHSADGPSNIRTPVTSTIQFEKKITAFGAIARGEGTWDTICKSYGIDNEVLKNEGPRGLGWRTGNDGKVAQNGIYNFWRGSSKDLQTVSPARIVAKVRCHNF